MQNIVVLNDDLNSCIIYRIQTKDTLIIPAKSQHVTKTNYLIARSFIFYQLDIKQVSVILIIACILLKMLNIYNL